jgi:histidinol dehydrogenase
VTARSIMDLVELADLAPEDRARLVRRSAVPDPEVRRIAGEIVATVRSGGDTALRAANVEYGGGLPDGTFRLERGMAKEALAALPEDLTNAMRTAEANIRSCHTPQRPDDHTQEVRPGVRVTRTWTPLRRVGIYVPGGRAAYPSSLLMGVVPAQVAGVDEIVVASPADDRGAPNPIVLAAAGMLGVDEFYVMGGAQAISALAYGTESIPRVDKIVGPGGAWVTAAKLAVYGDCGVDLPAGPSEAVILVDESAHPRIAAADLLCQAEHGPDSPIVLISTDRSLAQTILEEADMLATDLEREAIIRTSLADHGIAVVAADRETALRFAEEWAPEHLTIQTVDPARDAMQVPSSGSVFLGRWTPESAGDYATGANHVLPTGGLARSSGPLAVDDFGSWRQIQELTRQGLEDLAPTIRILARAEGLTAHAACVDVRLETP